MVGRSCAAGRADLPDAARRPTIDAVSDAPSGLTWEQANCTRDQAAELLALADGLAAVGALRTGRRAGQLSIFNFRLRAAADGSDAPDAPFVILMRAGVFRRHTFFARFTPAGADGAAALALSGPIDRDWEWRPPFEELRDRIVGQAVWREAVGAPYDERLAAFRASLAAVEPSRFAERRGGE